MPVCAEPSRTPLKESTYRPLADADEIRVLCLEAGDPSEPIQCKVHHVKLSRDPVYEALSYMWGPHDSKTISLGGQTFPVRENLWQALFHLRLEESSRLLWIDAICINQADESERNHQVMQMGQIFSRASRVLAWLGLDDPNTYVALEALKRVAKAPKYLVPRPRQGLRSRRLWNTKGMNRVERIQIELQSEEKEAIEELCSREYWQRLWIVQEINLPKDVLICCGYHQLEWTTFAQGLKDIVRDQTTFPISPVDGSQRSKWNTKASYTLCIDRSIFRRKGPRPQFKEPLGSLCRKYGSSLCEDVKDKIFGLQAMASPCCQEATVVDYGAPWLSIWQSVIVHHFLKHPNRPRLAISMAQELQQKLSVGQVDRCDWSESIGLHSSAEMQHVSIQGSLAGSRLRQIVILRFDTSSQVTGLNMSLETDTLRRLKTHVRNLLHTMPPGYAEQRSGTYLPSNSVEDSTSERSSTDYLRHEHGWTVQETQIIGNRCDVGISEKGLAFIIPKGCQVGDQLCMFECSDIIAVIRPDQSCKETDYSIVGRCITMGSLMSGRRTLSLEDTFGPPVDLVVDIPTLHLLTSGPPLEASMERYSVS